MSHEDENFRERENECMGEVKMAYNEGERGRSGRRGSIFVFGRGDCLTWCGNGVSFLNYKPIFIDSGAWQWQR